MELIESSDATKYKNKLAEYAESFPHMLDEFKKHYIFFNKNPQVDEYQKLYSSMKSNIQHATSQVFVTTNEIQHKIDELNSHIKVLNGEIDKEKIKNSDLKNRLGLLNVEHDTTGLMIDNYRELYNLQYFINFMILFGILFICYFVYKMVGNGQMQIPSISVKEVVKEAVQQK